MKKLTKPIYPTIDDLSQIIEIYNQAIRNRVSTGFQTEFSVEEMIPWFHEHEQDKFPILVAKENEKIIGWADIKPYRKSRAAFDSVVEVSYFIHNEFHRQGIGDILLKEIQIIAKSIGYKTMIAILMGVNTGSIKLLEKNEFELWGKMPEIINIDGILIDHLYYGKNL